MFTSQRLRGSNDVATCASPVSTSRKQFGELQTEQKKISIFVSRWTASSGQNRNVENKVRTKGRPNIKHVRTPHLQSAVYVVCHELLCPPAFILCEEIFQLQLESQSSLENRKSRASTRRFSKQHVFHTQKSIVMPINYSALLYERVMMRFACWHYFCHILTIYTKLDTLRGWDWRRVRIPS